MFTGLTVIAWVVGIAALYIGYRWDTRRATQRGNRDAWS